MLAGIAGAYKYHGYQSQKNFERANTAAATLPSRTAFQNHFGIPLRGAEQDIEKNNSNLADIASVLDEEQRIAPLPIASVDIIGKEYADNVIEKQYGRQYIADYDPHTQVLRVGSDATNKMQQKSGEFAITIDNVVQFCVDHEIKHGRTDQALTRDPTIIEKWTKAAQDDNGRTPYYSSWMPDWFERVNATTLNRKQLLELGIISQYSRTDAHEDIAELCAAAQTNPDDFAELSRSEYPTLWKKLDLAQSEGLIPREFGAYVDIMRSRNAQELEDRANAFLREHPKSAYARETYKAIGDARGNSALENAKKNRAHDGIRAMAVAEIPFYEQGIRASGRSIETLRKMMSTLANDYREIGDNTNAQKYANAVAKLDNDIAHNDMSFIYGTDNLVAKR
jgi:hypothetical protein